MTDDRPIKSLDPIGVVALANVLRFHKNMECSCELKCVCDNQCSCELKCVCDLKDGTNVLDLLTNPVFREVVQTLDVDKIRSIETFMEIVDELRAKIDAQQKQIRSEPR